MSDRPRYRAFVVAPTTDFVQRVVAALGDTFMAEGALDPLAVKSFAAQGPVHAVLIAESITNPTPEALAAAMRPALPSTAFVLLTRDVRQAEPGGPFDVAVRFPLADKVFTSSVKRAMRLVRGGVKEPQSIAADIEIRSLRLAEKSHYEVLGVPAGAGLDRITAAYDDLSLRYHPDRLRGLEPAMQRQAMELYLRVGEAYRVLRSPNARMRYDHGHAPELDAAAADAGPQRFADLSTLAVARKYLELAQKALIAGDTKMAVAHLRFASSQDPDNALIAQKLAELDVI